MASTVNTIEQESYVTAIAEIVSALVKAYELQVPINLSMQRVSLSALRLLGWEEVKLNSFMVERFSVSEK